MSANDIKKGFNNGYLMQTQTPKLAERFSKILLDREDDYAKGFLAGVKERTLELIKARTRTRHYDSKKISRTPKTPTKDKDRSKEDRDR